MRRPCRSQAAPGLVLLLAVALLARALLPSGWMPVATADGVAIQLCGMGSDAELRLARAAFNAALQGVDEDRGSKDEGGDPPCAFASQPSAGAAAPMPVPPPGLTTGPRPPDQWVGIGRGLAAPPPPATGPPLGA